MTGLRPVPDRPPRVIGMIRVSKAKGRDDLASPDIQRTKITDYATERGYHIADWREGLDESGSRKRSAWWPRLEEAVADVEAGTYDGIVVWRLSRFARDRFKRAVNTERVEAAGGFLESATERFDTTTPTGRLARGVVGELDSFMAEMISEGWKEAQARRIANGRPPSGRPQWGYVYDRDQKLHVPDPALVPVVASMYRRYIEGEPLRVLARWLNQHGYRTTAGGMWTSRTLRRTLDSGFASGRFNAGGDPAKGIKPTLHPGAHEAIIDAATWQAYLDARAIGRTVAPRAKASGYVLSGLVRCAWCGSMMVGSRSGQADGGRPYYRCSARKQIGAAACRGSNVVASKVEAFVRDWLAEVAGKIEKSAGEQQAETARRAVAAVEAATLARELGKVEEALTRLTVEHMRDPLPERVYRESRRQLDEQAATLQQQLELAKARQRRVVENRAGQAGWLLEQWDELPVTVRRQVLGGLIDCVLVRTERPKATWMRVVEWDEARG